MISRTVFLLSLSIGCICAQIGTHASFARGGLGVNTGHIGLIDRDSLFDADPIWSDMDGPIHPSMLRGGGFPGAAGLTGLGGGLTTGFGGNFNAPVSNFNGASQARSNRDFSRGFVDNGASQQGLSSQSNFDHQGSKGRFSQGIDHGHDRFVGADIGGRGLRSGTVSRTTNRSSSRSQRRIQSGSRRRVISSRPSSGQRLRLLSQRG